MALSCWMNDCGFNRCVFVNIKVWIFGICLPFWHMSCDGILHIRTSTHSINAIGKDDAVAQSAWLVKEIVRCLCWMNERRITKKSTQTNSHKLKQRTEKDKETVKEPSNTMFEQCVGQQQQLQTIFNRNKPQQICYVTHNNYYSVSPGKWASTSTQNIS